MIELRKVQESDLGHLLLYRNNLMQHFRQTTALTLWTQRLWFKNCPDNEIRKTIAKEGIPIGAMTIKRHADFNELSFFLKNGSTPDEWDEVISMIKSLLEFMNISVRDDIDINYTEKYEALIRAGAIFTECPISYKAHQKVKRCFL